VSYDLQHALCLLAGYEPLRAEIADAARPEMSPHGVPRSWHEAMLHEAVALLREYTEAFPAFRSKPQGSPYSDARKEQEADIAREDRTRAVIEKAISLWKMSESAKGAGTK
jgi:hypothetical protein